MCARNEITHTQGMCWKVLGLIKKLLKNDCQILGIRPFAMGLRWTLTLLTNECRITLYQNNGQKTMICANQHSQVAFRKYVINWLLLICTKSLSRYFMYVGYYLLYYHHSLANFIFMDGVMYHHYCTSPSGWCPTLKLTSWETN